MPCSGYISICGCDHCRLKVKLHVKGQRIALRQGMRAKVFGVYAHHFGTSESVCHVGKPVVQVIDIGFILVFCFRCEESSLKLFRGGALAPNHEQRVTTGWEVMREPTILTPSRPALANASTQDCLDKILSILVGMEQKAEQNLNGSHVARPETALARRWLVGASATCL
jgi:hypothetical protein